jgi:hypothetical protein
MRFISALAVSSLLLSTALAGCHITSHKNGGNDNVDIGTPFGSMQVKTNNNVDAMGLGITPYPGAQMLKKDKDNGAADVNMSFGNFHLGVKAVGYTTSDDQDTVIAFYKKDLGRYGVVLECEGSRTVGQPARTAEGLTCSDGAHKSGHISWDTDDNDSDSTDKIELRSGSKQRQHIVAVEKKDNATKIGLVSLDLPRNLSSDNHKDTD